MLSSSRNQNTNTSNRVNKFELETTNTVAEALKLERR